MLVLRNTILEMIARGADLRATFEQLCLRVEKLAPGMLCSVLQVDADGRLRPQAAPSLSPAYSAALDGLVIGPQVGSCGSAASLREPVIVTDIARDPRWSDYRHLALAFDLKACWSVPVIDAQGCVLATIGLYYKENRGPRPAERAIVDVCAELCLIALERDARVRERERLAHVDSLTGLANRAAFTAALDGLSCEEAESWALLMLDLDNLKVTNDSLGHPVGDQLIHAAALRAAEAAQPDRVFRTGGDEFAVLVTSPGALGGLDALAHRILAAIGEPLRCNGHTILPRATMGGAVVGVGDGSAAAVMQNADFALYHAKELRRGQFVRYWPGLDTRIQHRTAAVRDVDAALAEGRIEAHYQPIVVLATGEIIGIEALCRLRLAKGKLLSASGFHAATADPKIASELTGRMLEILARDMRDWDALGLHNGRVAINVAPADIVGGRLVDQITDAVERHGLISSRLVVEIGEAVFGAVSGDIIAHVLGALHERKIQIAIDDFGVCGGRLTPLRNLPFMGVKIDRSLIAGPDGIDRAVIGGLLHTARELGILVVAEGVEHPAQVETLRDLGCEIFQGYHFGRPLDRTATASLLLSRLAERQAPNDPDGPRMRA